MGQAEIDRLLIEGRRLLLDGKALQAMGPLRNAFNAAPERPDAHYWIAACLAHLGEHRTAQHVFQAAAQAFPDHFGNFDVMGFYQGRTLDAATTVDFYQALAHEVGEVRRLVDPCAILGPWEEATAPAAQATVGAVLAEKRRQWEAGEISEPSDIHVFDGGGDLPSGPVMVVGCRHLAGNPVYVEGDFLFHVRESLSRLHGAVAAHPADGFAYDPEKANVARDPGTVPVALAAFDAALAEIRPQVVLFEANFLGVEGRCITAEWLAGAKARHGFRLVSFVLDSYPPRDNFAAYWAPVSDRVVVFHASPLLDEVADKEKILLLPGLPFDAPRFAPRDGEGRDIGLLFAGSRTRHRDLWCAFAERAGLPLHAVLTDRTRAHSPDTEAFIALHRRAKVVLNNGVISSKVNIVTGRVFESMLAGALLLQQDLEALKRYYVPFVHYLPFANAAQMTALARYMLDHEDEREAMAEAALTWTRRWFSPDRYWRRVLALPPAGRESG